MANTKNLGLTLLETSQKDKVITINTNMQKLDETMPSPAVSANQDPVIMGLAPGSIYFNIPSKAVKIFIDGAWQQLGPPYLGDKASDPTDPLLPNGTRYYNTTANTFKTKRNGTWVNG